MSEIQHIQGLRELAAAFRALPASVGKHILPKSVAVPTALVRNDAQRMAPVDTGRLQSAVLMKRVPTERPDVIVRYIVGVRHGKRAQRAKLGRDLVNLDAYYWTFVEFGTSKMAAQPFLRPAYEQNKYLALNTMIDYLAAGVESEAAKLRWFK